MLGFKHAKVWFTQLAKDFPARLILSLLNKVIRIHQFAAQGVGKAAANGGFTRTWRANQNNTWTGQARNGGWGGHNLLLVKSKAVRNVFIIRGDGRGGFFEAIATEFF